MSNWIDPWINKEALKWYLRKHIERDELDVLLQDYVNGILEKRIILRPSKGCREYGKDIVFCEDEEAKSYCTYVIKKGDLQHNLGGKNGIINELHEALFCPLEDRQFLNRPRTAIVVHNGYEGSRAAYDKYEQKRQLYEDMLAEGLLLRPIERWDVDILTEKLFPHGEKLKQMEKSRVIMERQHKFYDISIKHLHDIKAYILSSEKNQQKSDSIIKDFYEKNQPLEDSNYSPSLYKKLKEIQDE